MQQTVLRLKWLQVQTMLKSWTLDAFQIYLKATDPIKTAKKTFNWQNLLGCIPDLFKSYRPYKTAKKTFNWQNLQTSESALHKHKIGKQTIL